MEHKIMEVLRRMQSILDEIQLAELKNAMYVVFAGCKLEEETSLRTVDQSWIDDLDDFLTSKALEGLSSKTVSRYRYELQRMLQYINKSTANINEGDISEYMRAYKKIHGICNQTLKNVRAVYSSFFAWLRDHGRIGINPMAMVEKVKVKKRSEKRLQMKKESACFGRATLCGIKRC